MTNTVAEQIKELHDLVLNGVLSEAEFSRAKAQLIGFSNNSASEVDEACSSHGQSDEHAGREEEVGSNTNSFTIFDFLKFLFYMGIIGVVVYKILYSSRYCGGVDISNCLSSMWDQLITLLN